MPGTVCPSSWHDYGHEREAAAIGERQSGTWQGWKNGGEAQLAAASNWAEQVSMADQIHMQCGSKERGGHKRSSRAGEAAGVEEVGRQARGWSHSSSHSLFVTGGREGQLSPPDRNTHLCCDNLESVNAQKQKKDKNGTYGTTTSNKASISQ